MKRFVFVATAAALAIACGGATDDPFDAGDGSAEAAPDGGPDTSGPWQCGDSTCGSGEYCIHPCCGGAPPMCEPYEDGGTCPPGTTPSTNCYNLGTGPGGCAPPPCTPPPPYCTPTMPSDGCPTSNGSRDCYEACA